jgi:hypothetical protein
MSAIKQKTPPVVATTFLDMWEQFRREEDQAIAQGQTEQAAAEAYWKFGDQLARFTGHVSLGGADKVRDALTEKRKARGWPDPSPGSVVPAIESAVLMLWIEGLRRLPR